MIEENKNSHFESSPETRVFPGDLLRAAREEKGLTTQEVANYLCLRRQLIEEIDDNKFDPKTANTFIRGYLKSYAKYVGVPEDDVLQAYSDLGLDKPAPSPNNMQSFSRKKARETQDNRLMLITYIIIAVLLASLVVFLWQQSGNEEITLGSEQTAASPSVAHANMVAEEKAKVEQATAEHEQTATMSVESVIGANQVTPNEQEASVTVDEVDAVDEVTLDEITHQIAENNAEDINNNVAGVNHDVVPQTNQTETVIFRSGSYLTAADPSAGELVLYFIDRSWVEVLDADDSSNRLAYGTKEQGYNMPIQGAAAYIITLGAPDAVEVYYQGQAVDLSVLPRHRVGQLRVPLE